MRDERLDDVRAAATSLHLAERGLADAVRAARANGHSWAAVGGALGTSRQNAFKRFGSPRDPRKGAGTHPAERSGPVTATTERVFTLVDGGAYDELRELLPDDVARVLTREAVLGTWAQVVAETGNLVRCEGTRVEPTGGEPADGPVLGTVVGATTLVCEAGEWHGRVAVGHDGMVLGLLVVPLGAAGLPF
ncbi:hypothetical protein F4692_002944 [Nocardioides cavernae]|uniref:Uncharacterized protein n=1 Tax=Nocardioides cavernae TaxID=1921566 RepID=A0A7Y9KQK1_9ACTN|nr:DUF3887 domain-containing protein [Nocardioides cavernae]NYE37811.1 hypothetical protein [Nocardioides cavernae]